MMSYIFNFIFFFSEKVNQNDNNIFQNQNQNEISFGQVMFIQTLLFDILHRRKIFSVNA